MQKTERRINYKKRRAYQEFLYILPLIILVGMFYYFPLYGWRYAFHDYRPPIPISSDNYVGFKWFNYIFSNPTRVKDILRVIRNTFAMSGISLLFSWFPMMFAVFLNEIRCKPYRKFVQTVTTLPNFISWVLVFSVAFNLFGSFGAVNSVLQELVLYLCSREAEAFMKLEAYPQFSEETEINRPGNWVFDLFGDMDLISFLFSGQYLRQDHPYHFSHWNDLQFYMPSVEPKQGLASLFD